MSCGPELELNPMPEGWSTIGKKLARACDGFQREKREPTMKAHSDTSPKSTRNIPMRTRRVEATILALLVAVMLAACDKKPQSGFDRPPAPVSLAAAVKEDVPVYIDSVGKAVAREFVSIQPQVSGRITGIHSLTELS